MDKYYIYIVTNKYNKVLYVGVTNNLQRRIYEHKSGLVDGFTKRYNLHKLVYAEVFGDIQTAIAREKQIIGWLRQKKIDLVNRVNPDWEEIAPF